MQQIVGLLLSVCCASADNGALWRDETELPASHLEAALIEDAADRVWDRFELAEAALIAAGADSSEQLRKWQLLLHQRRQGLRLSLHAVPHDAAADVLEQLHAQLLIGQYDADCSDLRTTLSEGDYNCVTATVLYLVLCDQCGLESDSLAIPAHVFCRLRPSGDEVQTTCEQWFRLGAAQQQQLSHLDCPRRRLDRTALIGKVYYNRGVTALQRGEFAEAVRMLRLSLLLDAQDQTARGNLLAALNNWALSETAAGRFPRAAQLLQICRELNPQFAPQQANDLYVHQRWIRDLCQRGEFASAMQLAEQGCQRQPQAELFTSGRLVIAQLWAESAWDSGQLQAGLAVFDHLRSDPLAAAAGLAEAEATQLLRSCRLLLESSDAARLSMARELLREARRRHPGDPRLQLLDDKG